MNATDPTVIDPPATTTPPPAPAPTADLMSEPTFEEIIEEWNRYYDDRSAGKLNVRDVPAGAQLSLDDVRVIEVSADSSLAVVASSQLPLVVGQYAKVRMVAGSLLASPMLQAAPLVGAGSAIVAVAVPGGELPVGLRERSRVQLVFPQTSSAEAPPAPVEGRVVGLPAAADSITGRESLSIEVAVQDAPTLAAAAEVRVVLLDPGVDPASAPTPVVTP